MVTVGIDEVGRGCWAGPLVAGAVIVGPNPENYVAKPLQLRDSKKLTKKQRERLADEIQISALAIGLGWVDAATIDKVGITTAVKLAMQRALQQIHIPYDEIIIDGNVNYLADFEEGASHKVSTIVKADDSVPAVSAASIVAKVARDKYMCGLTGGYLNYQFAKHVGYGTALHLELLQKFGVSDMHRRSFKPVQALLVQ